MFNYYKNIFLIDCTLFAYKAYYIINYKSKIKDFDKSFNVFINMIYSRYNKVNPDYIFFIFDKKNKFNYRNKIFNDYKSNRKKYSKNFKKYICFLKKRLFYFNLNIISIINIESDDVISYLTYKLNKLFKYIYIYILSYDKDFIQLVNNNIFIYNNSILNVKKIYKNYGLYPYLLKDYLVLCGDRSDNIPGIKGIGKKTALKILNKFGDIYNIYNNLNKLKKIGININIINNLKINFYNIRIWYRLVSFNNNIHISIKINDYIFNKSLFKNLYIN